MKLSSTAEVHLAKTCFRYILKKGEKIGIISSYCILSLSWSDYPPALSPGGWRLVGPVHMPISILRPSWLLKACECLRESHNHSTTSACLEPPWCRFSFWLSMQKGKKKTKTKPNLNGLWVCSGRSGWSQLSFTVIVYEWCNLLHRDMIQ